MDDDGNLCVEKGGKMKWKIWNFLGGFWEGLRWVFALNTSASRNINFRRWTIVSWGSFGAQKTHIDIVAQVAYAPISTPTHILIERKADRQLLRPSSLGASRKRISLLLH